MSMYYIHVKRVDTSNVQHDNTIKGAYFIGECLTMQKSYDLGYTTCFIVGKPLNKAHTTKKDDLSLEKKVNIVLLNVVHKLNSKGKYPIVY